ncbi:hypothetical protein [Chelatococcus sp.]|uniref:hypothetical protein n=1 Tax=Chelatococcus sp. TaxID=1953771 RepID=UPI001EC17ECB|nr:hypothetical protein [Chelatococcus sp.]MBX3547310.1 hypothetical protein [Chelatococcus sp.]CAH1677878.1 conserved hypothetical protein [Hyphomicrobiales bacterium]
MAITAPSGPLVVFGGSNNPDAGTSFGRRGFGIMDPRVPYSYHPGGSTVYGFLGTAHIPVIDAVPSTLAANNIAAAQAVGSATTLTLVAASAAGITVGVSITNAETGNPVTGLLAIDSAMGYVSVAGTSSIRLWDPSKAISRNVRITSVGNDSGITFTVRGYDLYGYPMAETITGANAGVASGTKAFKYIASVTSSAAAAGNVSVGTGDVIGLPLQANAWGSVDVMWNNAKVTASTGFTAAVLTDPATATTGDVRGTYALQVASNNTLRLQMFITPSVANIVKTSVGLFGVTQFSS